MRRSLCASPVVVPARRGGRFAHCPLLVYRALKIVSGKKIAAVAQIASGFGVKEATIYRHQRIGREFEAARGPKALLDHICDQKCTEPAAWRSDANR
jgi:hypothetical protein